MVSHKVEHFSQRCVKKWRHFQKGGSKSDAPFPNGKILGKKGESKSGALFKKVSQKVASFFKKGDESDTPVDRGFPVGAA